MRRGFLCVLLLFTVMLVGCRREGADFFDPFRSAYVAEVEGLLYGVSFSAKIEMGEQGEGVVAPATLTFYAPEELSGTTVTRAADGVVTLASAGVSVADVGGVGAALFSLFPQTGSATHAEVSEEGRTRVLWEGGEIEFLADGTPFSVRTEHVSVTIVSWCGEA